MDWPEPASGCHRPGSHRRPSLHLDVQHKLDNEMVIGKQPHHKVSDIQPGSTPPDMHLKGLVPVNTAFGRMQTAPV